MSSPTPPINKWRGSTNPLIGGPCFPITPSDSVDLTDTVTSGTGLGTVIIRAVTVNVGGTIAYLDETGVGRAITLPAGGPYPIPMKRILATGTAASGLMGHI